MARFYTYMMVMAGITLLMEMAGIPTGLDYFMSFMGLNGSDMGSSGLVIAIIAIFGLSVGASVLIGAFTRVPPESYLISSLALTLLTISIGTFGAIINYSATFDSWIANSVRLIFGVLSLGFAITTIEWWRGAA